MSVKFPSVKGWGMDFKSVYQLATTDGRCIKARIEVIDQSVTLHSRGGATGGQPPRNEGFAEALVIICQRAMRNRDYLERILLDSAPARRLPEAQRVLVDKPLAVAPDPSVFA